MPTFPAESHSPSPVLAMHTLQGQTMGTSWCVKLVTSPHANLHALHASIESQLDLVVAQMSTWEATSDITRFNHSAAGTWHSLPVEFFTVLACALQTARDSEGAYDPTIGPLVLAWGFGATQRATQVPTVEELAAARELIGWQKISLQTESRSVCQPGGFQLDLSAIAKGHAVDLVARHLRTKGIPAALVEVGGELFGYGRKPDDSPWQVLVEAMPDQQDEDEEENPARVIALEGLAIATSGDHWHAFEQQGTRYSHTLDPRTGSPVQHAPAAVTVIAADAMHADAWATALTVMGGEAGFSFAESRGLAARFVTRTDSGLKERMTEAFKARLPQ